MKTICSKCSARGTNKPGFPDGWYIQDGVLIVFECKSSDLAAAIAQLKIYRDKMLGLDQFTDVYFVAYVGTTLFNKQFQVYNLAWEEMDVPVLSLAAFGITAVTATPAAPIS